MHVTDNAWKSYSYELQLQSLAYERLREAEELLFESH